MAAMLSRWNPIETYGDSEAGYLQGLEAVHFERTLVQSNSDICKHISLFWNEIVDEIC